MSKYNVLWDLETKTLTLTTSDKTSKGQKLVSFIVVPEIGEIPDAASHPQPAQHLRNIAVQRGIEDFELVNVVNKTGNERLDKFEQKANQEKLDRLTAHQENMIISSAPYANLENEDEHVGGEEGTTVQEPELEPEKEKEETPA